MAEIKLDFKNSGVTQKSIMEYKAQVEIIHKDLHRRANDEKDFVGWLDLPTNYDKDEFERIKKAAKKIKKESDILVVIGIGGSYLGARAVIEALTSSFNNMLSAKQRKYPQILYVGNNLSPNYINELIEYIGDKDFSINVISKSGTTTEPAISFRIFREILENKYGIDEARSRIYATTDKAKGALTKQNRCSPTDFTDRHRCLGFEGLPQNPRNSQMRGCLQGICENLCNLWEFLFNSQLRIKVRSCRSVRTAVLLSVWRGICSPLPAPL